MDLDFKAYKVAAQYAEQINQGFSARLKGRFVTIPDDTPEGQAQLYGWRQCDDYERSQGREIRR